LPKKVPWQAKCKLCGTVVFWAYDYKSIPLCSDECVEKMKEKEGSGDAQKA
jgi:endogenous inhibitor of DNA gyrase (YacG/DUF329 family)